jgi:hypothetical protein
MIQEIGEDKIMRMCIFITPHTGVHVQADRYHES